MLKMCTPTREYMGRGVAGACNVFADSSNVPIAGGKESLTRLVSIIASSGLSYSYVKMQTSTPDRQILRSNYRVGRYGLSYSSISRTWAVGFSDEAGGPTGDLPSSLRALVSSSTLQNHRPLQLPRRHLFHECRAYTSARSSRGLPDPGGGRKQPSIDRPS